MLTSLSWINPGQKKNEKNLAPILKSAKLNNKKKERKHLEGKRRLLFSLYLYYT